MEAYLDNSATTRCCEEAAQLLVKLLTEDYGNPSSLHNKGVIAENYMNDARKKIAKTLKVQEKEICFTSGGTESNNLAIIGVAEANKRSGKHVITTSIEHPSVSATMAYLEGHGYEVTYLPVDAYGVISLDDLKAAIRPDTILVSLMQVNNEIGAVEPIAEAGALIKQCNPQTLFHVDAIQSYGKMRIYPAKMHVDLLSVSGHEDSWTERKRIFIYQRQDENSSAVKWRRTAEGNAFRHGKCSGNRRTWRSSGTYLYWF